MHILIYCQDPERILRCISEFLDCNTPDHLLREIQAKCSFHSLLADRLSETDVQSKCVDDNNGQTFVKEDISACQQRTLTPPDTWSCPTLGLACVLMSRPISPELVLSPDFWISNTPRYFSFAYYPYSIGRVRCQSTLWILYCILCLSVSLSVFNFHL